MLVAVVLWVLSTQVRCKKACDVPNWSTGVHSRSSDMSHPNTYITVIMVEMNMVVATAAAVAILVLLGMMLACDLSKGDKR